MAGRANGKSSSRSRSGLPMVEVHNDPSCALCDGAQSLKPEKYDMLLQTIGTIAPVVGKKLR